MNMQASIDYTLSLIKCVLCVILYSVTLTAVWLERWCVFVLVLVHFLASCSYIQGYIYSSIDKDHVHHSLPKYMFRSGLSVYMYMYVHV